MITNLILDFFCQSELGLILYPSVFLFSFLESIAVVGLLLPGTTVVSFLGMMSFHGYGHWFFLVLGSSLGALAGDGLSYWLGTKGTRFFCGEAKILKLAHLERGQKFFRRYGGKGILLGRFVGPLRPIIPFVAGLSSFSARRFWLWGIFSSVLWSVSTIFLGQSFAWVAFALRLKLKQSIPLFILLAFVVATSFFLGAKTYNLFGPVKTKE